MAGHAALDTLLCGPRIEYEADHAAGDPEGFARAGACEWTGVYRRPNFGVTRCVARAAPEWRRLARW
jgi:hypothetical protein